MCAEGKGREERRGEDKGLKGKAGQERTGRIGTREGKKRERSLEEIEKRIRGEVKEGKEWKKS